MKFQTLTPFRFLSRFYAQSAPGHGTKALRQAIALENSRARPLAHAGADGLILLKRAIIDSLG